MIETAAVHARSSLAWYRESQTHRNGKMSASKLSVHVVKREYDLEWKSIFCSMRTQTNSAMALLTLNCWKKASSPTSSSGNSNSEGSDKSTVDAPTWNLQEFCNQLKATESCCSLPNSWSSWNREWHFLRDQRHDLLGSRPVALKRSTSQTAGAAAGSVKTTSLNAANLLNHLGQALPHGVGERVVREQHDAARQQHLFNRRAH